MGDTGVDSWQNTEFNDLTYIDTHGRAAEVQLGYGEGGVFHLGDFVHLQRGI